MATAEPDQESRLCQRVDKALLLNFSLQEIKIRSSNILQSSKSNNNNNNNNNNNTNNNNNLKYKRNRLKFSILSAKEQFKIYYLPHLDNLK